MSKLSHSNPYLDDVYVDGDEYRFENNIAKQTITEKKKAERARRLLKIKLCSDGYLAFNKRLIQNKRLKNNK